MQWTTDTPKSPGFYWHRSLKRLCRGVPCSQQELKGEDPYFEAAVVRVTIDKSDPEWPNETYSACNYETEFDLGQTLGDLWAGPIPQPE